MYHNVRSVLVWLFVPVFLLAALGRIDPAEPSGWMIRGEQMVESTCIGRVYDFTTKTPLDRFTVSMAGNASSKAEFQKGEFVYIARTTGAILGKSIVVLRIEAENYTFADKKFEILPGQVKHVGDVFLVPMDPATKVIGPEGGDYESSDGSVQISVPAGAVDESHTFRSAGFPHSVTLTSPLPKSTHFTYCDQILPDVDEFNVPITVRTKNTRGFPAGMEIPAGYYDTKLHQWIADGMAKVSPDGQWVDYSATHLTTWDFNHPPPDPPRRRRPDGDDDDDDEPDEDDDDDDDDDDCEESESGYSKVSLRSGVLSQKIPLFTWMSGREEKTFALEYSSRCALPSVNISLNERYVPIKGERKPLKKVLEISVNDFYKKTAFPVKDGLSRYSLLLDCRDKKGNFWPSGVYTGEMILSDHFPVEFYTADYFGGPPINPTGILAAETDPEIYPTLYPLNVGVLNLTESPFGKGWAMSGLERIYWDGNSPILLSRGTHKEVFGALGKINTIIGTGYFDVNWLVEADGRPSVYFMIPPPFSAVMSRNYDIFILCNRTTWNLGIIYRVDRWGRVWTAGGGGWLYPGQCDGKPATQLMIQGAVDMEMGPGENIYFIHDRFYCARIDPDGIYHKIFMKNFDLRGLAVAPNGDIYYCRDRYVIKYDPVTLQHTYAAGKGGTAAPMGNGLDAGDVSFWEPYDVALDSEGSLYFTDRKYRQIYKVDAATNRMTILAGKYDPGTVDHNFGRFEAPALLAELGEPTYICLDHDGLVYFSDKQYDAVGMIDPGGSIRRIAGDGGPGRGADRQSAIMSSLDRPTGIHFGRDSTLLIPENKSPRVRGVTLGTAFQRGTVIPNPCGDDSFLYLNQDGSFTQSFYKGSDFEYSPNGLLLIEKAPGGITTQYLYDKNGNPTRIIDHWGKEVAIEYNAAGMVESVVSPGKERWTMNYDSDGNLVEITNPDLARWSFEYDDNSLMTSKKISGRNKTQYRYTRGRVSEIIPPTTGTVTLEHGGLSGDIEGTPEFVFPDDPIAESPDYPSTDTITDPLGNVWKTITDSSGLPKVTIDPLGNRTRYSFDSQNNALTYLKMPEGNVYEWQYNERGGLVWYIEPNGEKTYHQYNEIGQLWYIQYPVANGSNPPFQYNDYNTSGLLEATYVFGRYPSGDRSKFQYEYDQLERVKTITGPYGNTRNYHYGTDGEIEGITGFDGTRFDYLRDDMGRIAKISGPAGTVVSYKYDPMGNPVLITDGGDRPTSVSYSPEGLPDTIRTYDGRIISFSRDDQGRVMSMKSGPTIWNPHKPKGDILTDYETEATYTRDANGRVTGFTDPNGNTTRYDYDTAGNLVAVTDPLSNSFRFYYNANGDLVSYINTLGDMTRMLRDENRNILSITDVRTGDIVTMSYVPFKNKIEDRIYPDGTRIVYEYTSDTGAPRYRRNPDVVSYPNFDQVLFDELLRPTYSTGGDGDYKYEYDPEGRLTRLQSYDNPFTRQDIAFDYDCCGKPEKITDSESLEYMFHYDAAGRIISFETDTDTVTYRYEYPGNHPSSIEYPGGVVAEFTYTPLQQTQAIQVKKGAEILYDASCEYDGVGNCTRMIVNGEDRSYSYDALNRLTEVRTDGALTEQYTYDAMGNRLSDIQGNEYLYDDGMRLLRGGGVSYDYDGNGNATERRTSDSVLLFRTDWCNRLGEVEIEGGDVYSYFYESQNMRTDKKIGSTRVMSYLHSPYFSSEFIGSTTMAKYIKNPWTWRVMLYVTDAGDRNYIHYDAAQRPVIITDSDGNVTWKADYTTFGKANVWSGATITYNNRMPGQYFDGETGLHYNHHRYYDPQVGRFIQRDPMMYRTDPTTHYLYMASPYVYAHNNPLMQYDLTGLCDHCDQCPGGEWETSQLGFESGAVVGVSTYQVHAFCTSRIGPSFDHWISCLKLGLFAGADVFVGRIDLTGCSQAEAEANLTGWSTFFGGGKDPIGLSGGLSDISGDNWSWAFSIGFGLPIGVGYQHCWIVD